MNGKRRAGRILSAFCGGAGSLYGEVFLTLRKLAALFLIAVSSASVMRRKYLSISLCKSVRSSGDVHVPGRLLAVCRFEDQRARGVVVLGRE